VSAPVPQTADSPAVTAEALLATADRLLSSPPAVSSDCDWLGGHWPRTCALLIRLALEAVLDSYWERVAPSAAACSMRAQLLLLPRFADLGTATLARESWLGLSRAAHHHAYELAPTASEMRGWHSSVRTLAAALSPSQ
jgi:hypothetical protein